MTRFVYLIRLRVLAHLMLCILLLPSFAHASEYILIVTLREQIAEQTLSLVSVTLSKGRANLADFQPADGYTFNLFSKARKLLFTKRFHIPGPLADGSPEIQLDAIPFIISIPYLLESDTATIIDPKGSQTLEFKIPSPDELVDQAVNFVMRSQEGTLPRLELPRPPANNEVNVQVKQSNIEGSAFPTLSFAGVLFSLVLLLVARKVETKMRATKIVPLDNLDKKE